jgi:hypothetical protein
MVWFRCCAEKLMAWVEAKDLQSIEHGVWVRDRVLSYLRKQPAGMQTANSVRRTLRDVRRFLKPNIELTTAEMLQLINCRPTSGAQLDAVRPSAAPPYTSSAACPLPAEDVHRVCR